MPRTTRGTCIAITTAVLLAGTTSPAFAQARTDPHQHDNAAPPQSQPGGMMGGGMMRMMNHCPMTSGETSHTDGRIAFLKAELAITDAQKAVWDVYAVKVKDNLQSMPGMHKSMMAVGAARTPVERVDATIATMEGRAKVLKEVRPALVALYDALSPEQKKKADQLLTGMSCMM
jgi:LTXXQ motif family protein